MHGYTAIADLGGEIDAVTVPSDTLRETIETMGALATPSSYGTAAEQAAMLDKTCRDNEGNSVDNAGEPIGGGSGGSNEPPDEPWEGWQDGIPQEQCWWIITEQGNYTNC